MDKNAQAKIIRSGRRTIALQISPNGELVVKAPLRVSLRVIQGFIDQNNEWIATHLQKVKDRPQAKVHNFNEGDVFSYLGKVVTLTFYGGTSIQIKDTKLLFPNALVFRAEKEMTNWYIKEAKNLITRRVEFYQTEMKVTHNGLTFTDTKSQWGRCSHDNRLQFSWRLIMAPILTINYVVVHELTHISEKNHSRKFWDRVRYFNPSYRQQVKWLKEHGNSLH